MVSIVGFTSAVPTLFIYTQIYLQEDDHFRTTIGYHDFHILDVVFNKIVSRKDKKKHLLSMMEEGRD